MGERHFPATGAPADAQDLCLYVPLFVYSHTGDNPFHEDACTVEINAHGGLISMQTAVLPAQKLLVMNKTNESTQRCVVLSVRARLERGVDVAFEFPAPTPQFWQNLEMVVRFRLSESLSVESPIHR